ncbi:MAG: FAD-dependent monooxygenase, partial [bacterium]|nr:FAD-dependent monooxygenase [bacterium]
MGEWTGEVLIVGGGPVGLLLGNLLGQQGIRCAVVEQRREPLKESRAIGVMPPSLHILKHLGLDRAFVEAGVQVVTAQVHNEWGPLGRVDFGG